MAHVYVIVRGDIPNPHQAVQVSHAAIAATFAYGEPRQPHPNLVVCTVPSEEALLDEFERLKAMGVACCLWRENDMDNQATAIGTGPLRGAQRRPLRRLPLLK